MSGPILPVRRLPNGDIQLELRDEDWPDPPPPDEPVDIAGYTGVGPPMTLEQAAQSRSINEIQEQCRIGASEIAALAEEFRRLRAAHPEMVEESDDLHLFICPGWPPPPHGDGCGETFAIRHGQSIDVVEDGVPATLRATAEVVAELGEGDVLCRACAGAMLEDARG
jgi:hypothetical protein